MPLETSASGFRLVRVALSCAALSLLLLAGALPAVASTGSGRTGSVRSRAGHRHQERPGAHHGRLYQGSLAKAAIIGGVEADPGTFPFLAYIVDKRGEEVGFCTGTVLSVNVILTAGHCAEDTETGLINEPSGYAIVTGTVEWTSSARQVTGVSKVIVYPGYSRSQATADAALLVLSNNGTFYLARHLALGLSSTGSRETRAACWLGQDLLRTRNAHRTPALGGNGDAETVILRNARSNLLPQPRALRHLSPKLRNRRLSGRQRRPADLSQSSGQRRYPDRRHQPYLRGMPNHPPNSRDPC